MTYRATACWVYPDSWVEVICENDGTLIEAVCRIEPGYVGRVTLTAATGKDHSRRLSAGRTNINISNPSLADSETRVGLDIEPV